ncbi:O-antigen polymerase [Vogesella oryzae]|uniref:O-antigen polymerase n=1 Tax=Vogesella oryzae TaxID=1735285 RepID=UPI00158325EC|nr:O-antigen polymerase [Vogesella oryzae]
MIEILISFGIIVGVFFFINDLRYGKISPVLFFSPMYILGFLNALSGYLSNYSAGYFYYVEYPGEYMPLALLVYVGGFLLFVFGVFCAKNIKWKVSDHVPYFERVMLSSAPWVCWFLLVMALLNFLYVAYVTSGGVLEFLGSIALRKYQHEDVGYSTFLYPFSIIGCYVYAVNRIKRGWNGFGLYAIITLLIFASEGRITLTLLSLAPAFFIANFDGGLNIKKVLLQIFALMVLAVIFFVLRYISSAGDSSSDLVDVLFSLLIDRGNVPNFPVLIVLLQKMGKGLDFTGGLNLLEGFAYPLGLVKIFGSDWMLPWIIKSSFFYDDPGGGLPLTIFGASYAAFGFAGVLVLPFFMGFFSGVFGAAAISSRSYFFKIFYLLYLTTFIFLAAKTDFSQLSAMLVIAEYMVAAFVFFGVIGFLVKN